MAAFEPRRLRPFCRAQLRPTALAALLTLQGAAWALPQGATPAFGQTRVSQPNASTLLVQQTTPTAGIDWARFSIAAGETVRFAQPSPRAVIVNRVGGTDPSQILGSLQANGSVFLINPRGVVFGQGAQVDVGSLVASSLSLSPADAAAGRWRLQATGDAGEVRNEGTIRAGAGTVVLAGPQVSNTGGIDARRIGLAAASAVSIDLDGDGLILLNARAADAARLDQLGALNSQGGSIELRAVARSQLAPTVLNVRGTVMARGLSTSGGEIVIDGGPVGITQVAARVSADGARGGGVQVLGHQVLVENTASLSANGTAGGGSVLVGGDYQGKNPAVRNAAEVIVQPGAQLGASATERGDGGKVVVWSDGTTVFDGAITARGGPLGGNGGVVETSGKQSLGITVGSVDAGSPAGKAGTWLLDPTDITIDSVPAGAAYPAINGLAGAQTIRPATLDGANASVTLSATNDIEVKAGSPVTLSTAAAGITLNAGNQIRVNAGITTTNGAVALNSGAGGITLAAGQTIAAGTSTIALNAGGGNATLAGALATGNATASAISITNAADLQIGNISPGAGGTTTLSFTGTGTQTAGTSIATGSLVKAGTGTLTLSQANTYGGTTTVSAGTLATSAAQLIPDTSAVTVANGATLTLGGAETVASLALSGTLAGAGPLTATGIVLTDGTIDTAVTTTTLTSNGNSLIDANVNATASATVASGTLTIGPAGLLATPTLAIDGGTLATTAGSADEISDNAAITVASGAVLAIRNAETVASLSLSGTLAGIGTLTTTGASALTGGTVGTALNADTLTSSGSSAIDAAASAATSATITGGTLTIGPAGQLASPLIAITGGTLQSSGNEALADGSALQIGNSATLRLGGDETIASLAGPAGSSVALGSHTLTVAGAASTTFDGVLADGSGTGNLTKAGAGTLTLTGANAYAGSTDILGGTLRLSGATATAGASGGTVSVAAGATLDVANGASLANRVTSNGGTLATSAGNGSLTNDILINADTTLNVAGASLNVTGAIGDPRGLSQGSVAAGLSKTGAGTATLEADSLFLGPLNVAAGTLVVNGRLFDNVSFFPGAVSIATGASAATLDLRTNNNPNISVGALSAGSGGTLLLGNVALTVNDVGANARFSGVVDGPSTSLTKRGSGTMTLDGQARTHLVVEEGGLDLPVQNALQFNGQFSDLEILSGSVSVGADQTLGTLTASGGSFGGSGTLFASNFVLGGAGNPSLGNFGTAAGGNGNTGTQGAMTLAGDIGLTSLTLNNPVVFSSFRDVTTSTRFTGSQGITKRGSGTLEFNGSGADSNDYAGDTTIEQGTLRISGASAKAGAGAVSVAAGSNLDLANGASITNAVALNGGTLANSSGGATLAGALTLGSVASVVDVANALTLSQAIGQSTSGQGFEKIGGGTLTLTQTGTYSGPTTVSNGTLQLSTAPGAAGSGAIVVGTGGNLDLAGGATVANAVTASGRLSNSSGTGRIDGTLTLAGDVVANVTGTSLRLSSVGESSTGSGLTKLGGGDLTLGAPASYSGATHLDAGRLLTTGANVIPDASTVTLANATTLVLGGAERLGTLNGNGGVTTGGLLTLGSGTYGGIVTGPNALVKDTTGILTLTNANDYSGGTTVSAGTLAVSGPTATAGAGGADIRVQSSARLDAQGGAAIANPITLAGGTLANSAGTASAANTISLTATSALDVAGTLTIGGQISDGANSFALQKLGAGTAVLTVANAYKGGTTIANGTLALDGASASVGPGAVGIAAPATLDLRRGANATNSIALSGGTVSSSAGDGSIDALSLTAGGNRLSAGPASTLAVNGVIGGGGFDVGISGPGTVAFAAPETYTGATTVASGVLRLAATSQIASSVVAVNGGTLQPLGTNALPNAALSVGAGGTLALGNVDQTVRTFVNSGGSVTGTGLLSAATYTLNGGTIDSRLGSGDLIITGPTQLNNTAAVTQLHVNAGSLAINSAGLLTGTPAITVEDPATLNLTGSESASSLTLRGTLAGNGPLNAPIYSLDSGIANANLGAGTLTSQGRSELNGTAAVTVVSVANGTLKLGSGGRLADNAVAAAVAGGATLQLGGNETLGSLNGNGDVALGAATLTTGTTGGADAFGGTLSGTGGGLTKVGTGSLTLSGASSYTGTTQVASGRLITAGDDRIADASALLVQANAVFQLGGRETVGSLAGPGNVELGSFTLSAGGASATTFGGVMSGTGGFTKLGQGSLTLAGANSYAGPTTVSGGTLVTASAERIADNSTLTVGTSAALQLGGTETVQALTLSGTLNASTGSNAQLIATTYLLDGGVTNAALGPGVLSSTGNSTLNADSAATQVNVNGGSLRVTGSAPHLAATPGLTIAAGATLSLAANEAVGAVANSGTLSVAGALTAASLASPGNVSWGDSITATSGDLIIGGTLTAASPSAPHSLVATGDIVASNPSNALGSGPLTLQANSVKLVSSGDIGLSTVKLAGGDSSITSAQHLDLGGTVTLAAGTLDLIANAARDTTGGIDPVPGTTFFIPSREDSGANRNPIRYARPSISQSGGSLETAAGSALRLLAPNGGSIVLDRAGNLINGALSAQSGASGDYVYPADSSATAALDRVVITNTVPLSVATASGMAGIEGDVIELHAPSLTTAPDAALHVRLPYAGGTQVLPGLVLDVGSVQAGSADGFGSPQTAITITGGRPFGVLISVQPQLAADAGSAFGVYFGCGALVCPIPTYQWGGVAGAVPVFYNGVQLTTAPSSNNAISSNTSLLENARRALFEEAVHTENVAPRLRAGVIAEVGSGRPATEGLAGARRPATCEAEAGTLSCAAPASK